jgi:hypothetical protein
MDHYFHVLWLSQSPVTNHAFPCEFNQVEVDDMSYEELYEFFGPGRVMYGASPSAIASLPLHIVGERDRRDSVGNPIGCPICLQVSSQLETYYECSSDCMVLPEAVAARFQQLDCFPRRI